ncbi:hypothetical protein [Streptomyces tropicalis]|uniref:hypothetical protein n=1 Tax=Streptomyces tropicalis TaxID=3034234 RepID=UPI0028BD4E47|nr:hypothetical protein [Streptomyces tropicalis]
MHRTLGRHRRGRAAQLVSHRLGTLREADSIALLVDGRIAERGSHDALMSLQNRDCARLFGLQAAGYAAPGERAATAAAEAAS